MRMTLRRGGPRRSIVAVLGALAVVVVVATANPALADDGGVSDAPILGIWEAQSLNGINNNPFFPSIGSAGTQYLRIGSARYADGRSQMVSGPAPRSNAAKLSDLAQVDGGWPVVFGSGVGGAFDSVGVVAGSFDDAGVGAVSAFVSFFEDFSVGGLECCGASLRGKNPPGW
jgi:hypothetical protein